MAHPQDRGLGIDQIRQALEVRGNQFGGFNTPIMAPPPEPALERAGNRFGFSDPRDRPSAALEPERSYAGRIGSYGSYTPEYGLYDETIGQQDPIPDLDELENPERMRGPDEAISDLLTNVVQPASPTMARATRHAAANLNYIEPEHQSYVHRFDPVRQQSRQVPGDDLLTGFYDKAIHAVRGLSPEELGETAFHEGAGHGARSWKGSRNVIDHRDFGYGGLTRGIPQNILDSLNPLHKDYDPEQEQEAFRNLSMVDPFDVFGERKRGEPGFLKKTGGIQALFDADPAYANHPLTPFNLDADFPGRGRFVGDPYFNDYSGVVQSVDAPYGRRQIVPGYNIGIGNLSPDAAFTTADLAQLTPEVGFFGTGIDLGGDSVGDDISDMTADDYSDSYAF